MSRPSHYTTPMATQQHTQAGPGQQQQSAAARRLAAKRQELEGLLMLREQSARLARDVDALGDNTDALVEGGEAVAAVMTSWTGAFRAIQIARDAMLARAGANGDEELGSSSDDAIAATARVPETLVRLPAGNSLSAD